MRSRTPGALAAVAPAEGEGERKRLRRGRLQRWLIVVALALFTILLLPRRPPTAARVPAPAEGAAPVSSAPTTALVGLADSAPAAAPHSLPATVQPIGGPLPVREPPPLRVGLIMLIVEHFPAWWPFLVATYARNSPQYTLIAVHTADRPPSPPAGDAHIRYVRKPLDELVALFARKLGTTEQVARAKFASGKGLSDLKPFYGKVFDELLDGYTHWGWVDWDLLLGDLSATVITLPGHHKMMHH